MIIDYRNITKFSAKSGICFNAIGIYKGTYWGRALDARHMLSHFNGVPMIVIEREKGKDINILINNRNERDKAFEKLVKQIKNIAINK